MSIDHVLLTESLLKIATRATESNCLGFPKIGTPKMQSDNIHSRLSFPPPTNAFNSKPWQNDKFQSISNATRKFQMNLSNIHYNVSEQDLLQLFGGPSAVISCKIDYDESGRSLGTATILFVSKESAQDYSQKYQGQMLDGRLLNMELVGYVKPKENKQQNNSDNKQGKWKNKGASLDDRLGKPPKKDLDSRLGKTLDDRLGPKVGSILDRLGPKEGGIADRLGAKKIEKVGKKQRPKKKKAKQQGESTREIKSYEDLVPGEEMVE